QRRATQADATCLFEQLNDTIVRSGVIGHNAIDQKLGNGGLAAVDIKVAQPQVEVGVVGAFTQGRHDQLLVGSVVLAAFNAFEGQLVQDFEIVRQILRQFLENGQGPLLIAMNLVTAS